jgi:hypothetical protein
MPVEQAQMEGMPPVNGDPVLGRYSGAARGREAFAGGPARAGFSRGSRIRFPDLSVDKSRRAGLPRAGTS